MTVLPAHNGARRAVMRISKLNLYGFKSFPDRTVIVLGAGISCVVGPNGCGKSNVLDAIKWCIGEQSAKSMRGSEMLDVIFAGSTERPPVGFAEVTLTLVADGGEPFPGEYADLSELEIGRRLHRSGTSEYFINRVKCRRKDILTLFMDTGVGSSLYSFIEQGRVDAIVNAAPLDRRSLIDEAAGISGYKMRRSEALQRIQATGVQLDRAADVADELGRRLRSVRQQVRRAAQFRRFRGLVRQREIALALIKYAALSEDRRALRDGSGNKQRSLHNLGLEEQQAKEELESRETELAIVEGSMAQWRDQVADHDGRLRELQATAGFIHQQRQQTAEALARGEAELKELNEEQQRLKRAAEQANVELGEGVLERKDLASRQGDLIAEQAERQIKRKSINEQLMVLDDQLQKHLAELAATEAVFEQRRRRVESLPVRKAEVEGRAVQLKGEQKRLEQHYRDLAEQEGDCVLAAKASEEHLSEAIKAQENAAGEVSRLQAGLVGEEQRHRSGVELNERTIQELLASLESRFEELEVEVTTAEQQGEGAVEALLREWQERLRITREEQAQAKLDSRLEMEGVLDGLGRQHLSELSRLEAGFERKRADLEGKKSSVIEEAQLAGAAAMVSKESELRQEHTAERESAQAELGARKVELSKVIDRLGVTQVDIVELRSLIGEKEGRLNGLEQSISALLPAPVEGHSSLLEQGTWSPVESWRTRAIGDRLMLPIFDSIDAVLAAQQKLMTGEGFRGLLAFGKVEEQLLMGVEEVDDLKSGLEFFRSTGQSVVVRGSGDRIDRDGVFSLGDQEDPGVLALQLSAEAENLRTVLKKLREDLYNKLISEDRVHRAHQEVVAQVSESEARLLSDSEEFHQRLTTSLAEMREAVSQDLLCLREEADESLRLLRGEREGQLRDVRTGHERLLRESRKSGEAQLRELESDRTRSLSELEEARDIAIAEQRALSAARVVALKQAARARQQKDQEGLLALKEEATKALASSNQLVQQALQALDAGRVHFQVTDLGLGTTRASHLELSLRLTGLREALRSNELRRQELISRLTQVKAEREELIAASDISLDEEKATIIKLKETVEGYRANRSEVQRAHEGGDRAIERGTEQQQELGIRLGTQEARIATAQERIKGSEELLSASVSRFERVERDKLECAETAALLETQEKNVEKERTRVELERGVVWDRLERERRRISELKKSVQTKRQALTEHRERMEAQRTVIASQQEKVQGVQVDIEVLRRRISERYQISLAAELDKIEVRGQYEISAGDAIKADFSIGKDTVKGVGSLVLSKKSMESVSEVENLLSELEEHRNELDKLGQVNLAAFEEFEELSKRHGELESQRADLEDSVQSIRSAIAKMNRLCRQRFRDAFDSVNENFQEVYPSLVGGGSAKLSLTNEDDLLETGVDIYVQPPGKRPQNLSLLSGGEKAMAAIALLLALFRVKPSPFCVLDEVDAPLDEANGARFNTMLKEMARVSQFLVITHNRKTMECADTLYGITMPDPGVSRLVSVDLGQP